MYSFADLNSPIYPLTLLIHPLKGPLTRVLNMLSVQLCVGMLVDGSSSLQSFGTVLVFLQRDSDCSTMIVSAALCCVWQVFDFFAWRVSRVSSMDTPINKAVSLNYR